MHPPAPPHVAAPDAGAALSGSEEALSRRLTKLYEAQDEQIRKVLADESLSEAERAKRVAAIQGQAKADAAKIVAAEAELKHKAVELEAELERYEAAGRAAQAAASDAVSKGLLAPTALEVEQELSDADKAVARLKFHRTVHRTSSFAETGDLDAVNDRLEQANAQLRAEVDRLSKADAV